MKLGLMTAALPAMSLEEIARWAPKAASACWRSPAGRSARRTAVTAGQPHRRYGYRRWLRRRSTLIADNGLEISSLAYYPNPLHPDQGHREEVIGHLKTVIDAAQLLGGGHRRHLHEADQNKAPSRIWRSSLASGRRSCATRASAGVGSPSRTARCSGQTLGLAAPTSPIRRRYGSACSRSFRTRTSGSITTLAFDLAVHR